MPIGVKILIAGLLAFMVGGTVFMLNNSVTGDARGDTRPQFVEALIPPEGGQVLRQNAVGIDLAEGYDGYLIINGTPITNTASEDDPDGLLRSDDLGIIRYNPAPGQRIEALTAPEQCVTALAWRRSEGPAAAEQVEWCFGVT